MEETNVWFAVLAVIPAWAGMIMGGWALRLQWLQHHARGPGPGPHVDIQVMGYLKLPTSLAANIDVINSGDAPAMLWNFYLHGSDAHVYPLDIQSLDGEDTSVVIPAHSRKHLALKGSPDASARDAEAKEGSPPVLKVHASYRREPIACPIPPRLAELSDKMEADSVAFARRQAEREA